MAEIFQAQLLRFGNNAEKTGWTYFIIDWQTADKLLQGTKTSFRVKGHLDDYPIKSVALLPMGDGNFIMPFNAQMRKALKKKAGDNIMVSLEYDPDPLPISESFIEILQDEPKALDFFNTLSKSHQNYFSKWIESAKTLETKSNRILKAIKGLSMQMGYPETIRYFKENEKNY